MNRAVKIAIVVGLMGLIGVIWWSLLPPKGFITALYPIDGERSAFVMRANYKNKPSVFWVGVVGPGEHLLWHRSLPGSISSVPGGHGMTADASRIILRVSDRSTVSQWLAFDTKTGESLWQSERSPLKLKQVTGPLPWVSGTRPEVVGDTHIAWEADGEKQRLVARAVLNGETRWVETMKKPHNVITNMQWTQRWLIYRHEHRWSIRDLKTGDLVLTVNVYSDACVDEDRFVAWSGPDLAIVDLTRDTLKVEMRPTPDKEYRRAMTCGRWGNKYVFYTQNKHIGAKMRSELVVLPESLDRIEWRLPLGQRDLNRIEGYSADYRIAEAHPLKGELADFVPIVTGTFGVDEFTVTVIDMKKQKIAWESAPKSALLHYGASRGTNDQHFIVQSAHVVAIDGKTGQVTGVIGGRYYAVRPFYGRAGRLWLYVNAKDGWPRINALPWGVVDGRTLNLVKRGNSSFDTKSTLPQTIKDWAVPSTFVSR